MSNYNTSLQSNNTDLRAILEAVNALPEAGEGGINTSDATATADKIFLNETAYVDGEKITGSFTIDNELTTQDNLLAQLRSAMSGKAAGFGNGQIVPLNVSKSGTYEASSYIPLDTEIQFKDVITEQQLVELYNQLKEYEVFLWDNDLSAYESGDWVVGYKAGSYIVGVTHDSPADWPSYLPDGYAIELYSNSNIAYSPTTGWINPRTGETVPTPAFSTRDSELLQFVANSLSNILNMPSAYNPVTVSSSGEYETYTLNVNFYSAPYWHNIYTTVLQNGVLTPYINYCTGGYQDKKIVIENALIGMPVFISNIDYFEEIYTSQNIEVEVFEAGDSYVNSHLICIKRDNSNTATISIWAEEI